jgi:hypothetical protein
MDTPVSGTPRMLLRLEGLVVLLAAVVGYRELDTSWRVFALLFLLPDVALLAYLAGPRAGAFTYNTLHTYFGPAGLGALTYLGIVPAAWPICLIWMAHIGMDRALGLGLKFSSAFQATHLGWVGRAGPTA